jgi:signal-transduction protein with cAMP-binding, CBS, and nucleotidyltransferase domain
MTLSEKIFVLRRLPVLEGLSDAELAVLADAAREREFPAGTIVCSEERPMTRLLLVCQGAVTDPNGRSRGHAPGAADMLVGREAHGTMVAGPEGARCLQVPKSHLFTLVRQCPAFVVSLLSTETAVALRP